MPEYEVTPDGPANAFSAAIRACLISDIAVASGHVSPVRFLRSRARAATDGMDNCTIMLLLSGALFGEIAGAPVTAGAGSIVTFDLRLPVDITTTGLRFVSLTLPRRLLAEVDGARGELHGLAPDGVTTRLLIDHILALQSHLPSITATDAPGIARATTALIGACLSRTRPIGPAPAGHGLQFAARRYIDANLAEPLTPETICRALRCSRSTLYRVFAPLGGIAAYIRDRRLDAACAMLCDGAGPHRLHAVAEQLGFTDAAGFAKAFRRRFGITPGQVRHSLAVPATEAVSARATFERWNRSVSQPAWDVRADFAGRLDNDPGRPTP